MTKHQTIVNAEEQHLAAMSTTSSSATTSSTTTKKVKKTILKRISTESFEEYSGNIEMRGHQKLESLKEATQQLSAKEVLETSSKDTQKMVKAVSKSVRSKQVEEMAVNSMLENQESETSATSKEKTDQKKRTKSKKVKKAENESENISVKTSFSKFDALQKRNLIHVRSSDAGKAQEKFSNPQEDKEINCRLCSKPVYKMEEIKAEKSIYHKNCFRCHECNKQLKVDNYESHEGVPYCSNHFKLLFAPKTVEDVEPEQPRKPELIIRENQPESLPPGVARASDKPDLGLEDLHQLNVRSRFQVFENGTVHEQNSKTEMRPANVKRSTSILSKLAKLQAHGFSGSINGGDEIPLQDSDSSSSSEGEEENNDDDIEDSDADLVRAKKRTRERPVGIGKAMDDIKTKFEKGPFMSKDERREERKQEIQNIRSRLFMGKQARIKEMYQQAVADSEQGITSTGKKPDVEMEGVTRSIKERFEKGEVFKADGIENENESGIQNIKCIQKEADVFESGISKQSRSIFMELDANVASGKTASPISMPKPRETQKPQRNRMNSTDETENEIVKCDEKADDVKIETSEISQKFKFFETYRPSEGKKKQFRITPPREGVVKMPSPDDAQQNEGTADSSMNEIETNLLEKSRTTAKMLDKFREMEQNIGHNRSNDEPRPLKCFTPPPDGGRRLYEAQDSGTEETDDDYAGESSEDGEYDEETKENMRRSKLLADDEALKEAQAAARAKQLRAKFEKWEAGEIQREKHEGRVDLYSQQVSEDNIESTKSIRQRFENLKNESKTPAKPRYQVNRFVQ